MAKNRFKLDAQPRDKAGKGTARALRRDNLVPSVIYGDNKDPMLLSLTEKEITKEYNTGSIFTNLCELSLDGKEHLVLARDVQRHPVTDRVIHVDFLRVTPKTKIAVDIPVHFVNEDAAPGIRDEKGIINIVRYTVELLCSATNIPESLELDLTGLNIGDAIKMSDAKLPEGTQPTITDRDFTIATIAAPKIPEIEEDDEAEGEEGEVAEGEEGEATEGEEGASEGNAEKAEGDDA